MNNVFLIERASPSLFSIKCLIVLAYGLQVPLKGKRYENMAERWPAHLLGQQDETRPKEEQLETAE
jgi:hypothetical protein